MKISSKPLLCAQIAAMILLAACDDAAETETATLDPSLAPAALGTRHLHVSNARLRDELDREVILRGFNAGGRAKMPPFLPFDEDASVDDAAEADAYFARIAALGANLVRLTFSWEGLEPERGTYSQPYLDQYAQMLDAAYANGLSVIVDFHQDVFASPFCGDGFPLWAIGDEIAHGPPRYDCGFPDWALPALDATSDVSRAFDRLWSNTDGLQDDMEAMWRRVAAEYADHPAVAGFEVINEPGAGSVPIEVFESETLPRLYERMGSAIHEVASGVPVFGGGRTGDSLGTSNHLAAPDLPGFVYAPHFYDPAASLGGRSLNAALLSTRIGTMLEPAQRWGVPAILGEFGSQNSYPYKAEHFDIIYDALDAHLASGAMWDASQTSNYWNSEDFSVLRSDRSEQPWAFTTDRAYPRAVAGHIVRFSWSAETATFELAVDNATAGVSEIHLPARHLGDAPTIRLSGDARYRLMRERSLLLVAATPGQNYSLTVSR
ncbi:MAG: cellulase family glycosylhydrolase [Sandaracinaceae bacterium]|jgi:endoglycosylceramidase|nr:cellulase family glycosylhydrolase [Sandaracinaceae bacterium]